MRIIDLKTTNPNINLATEDYLLHSMDGDFFMLWQNEPSIIVGRNQNTWAEINIDYVREKKLPVVRRLTGGGAVFHDLGNLNYTFIEHDASDKFGNYAVFSKPILEVLNSLGIPAELKGRNDLCIDGKKFSGNAQTMWHSRMLHHGTLLFSASVNDMTDALKVNPLKIRSKGIKSVRSRVTNISEHLTSPLTLEDFRRLVLQKVLENGENELYTLTDADNAAIKRLYDEKYSLDSWNYGFDKQFSFSKDTLFSSGIVSVRMDIEENIIRKISINGDFFGISDISALENALTGAEYDRTSLHALLEKSNIENYIAGVSADEFITAMM